MQRASLHPVLLTEAQPVTPGLSGRDGYFSASINDALPRRTLLLLKLGMQQLEMALTLELEKEGTLQALFC